MNSENKQIIKGTAIAVVIALVGIGILGWQYHQLEEKRLPAIEEEIAKQKEEMARRKAQDVLERFLETRDDNLLTERAMEQKKQKELFLIDDDGSYEIVGTEKISEKEYRFLVKIGDYIHVISLIEISNKYYIDSVEIAG